MNFQANGVVRFLTLACLLCLRPASLAIAEEYRNAQWHFHFRTPPDWQQIDAAALAEINARAASMRLERPPNYVAGFVPASGAPGVYLLAQIQPGATDGLTYEALEASFGKAPAEFEAVKSQLQNGGQGLIDLKVGEVAVDRKLARFVMRAKVQTADGDLQVLSVGHLGASSIVTLHGYSPTENLRETAAPYDAVNSSFAFDEGEQFVEPSGIEGKWFAPAVLIGAVIGGMVAIVLKAWNSRRRRPAPSAPPA